MKKIILASGSPRRKELLEQIQIRPIVIPSSVEEKITKTEAYDVVMELSEQKCLDVADKILNGTIQTADDEKAETERSAAEQAAPGEDKIAAAETGGCVVLGADTVVVLDGKILGKPSSEEDACEMLRGLQGREHQVYTGVTIAWLGENRVEHKDTFYVSTSVSVAPMSEAEIKAYVCTGDPMDKAGAYGIQGIFARHVEKIDGDYNNVVGLPVAEVYRHLKEEQLYVSESCNF